MVGRCITLIGDWANVLAGLTLTVGFLTYYFALQVHHCDPRDGNPCTSDNKAIIFWGKQGNRAVYETAHWFMFIEGFLWMIGGLIGAYCNIAANNALLAANQTIIAFGGFFFACSAWGSPANIISLRYLVPIAYWNKTGTVPKILVSFADVCPFYGIMCFMIATTMGMCGVYKLPKGNPCSPFWGVLCYWIGAWIIGVVTLYVPMLAGGLIGYSDVSLTCKEKGLKCILDMPIIAWYWTKLWAVIGAVFLTLGALIFGFMDKFWSCGTPKTEVVEVVDVVEA